MWGSGFKAKVQFIGSQRGVGLRGEGTREPWGTLRKLRVYKGIMGITRLRTLLGPSPLMDILVNTQCMRGV